MKPAPILAERCPHCGEWCYAVAPHDPLKRHVDHCEAKPVDDDDEREIAGHG